MSDYNSVFKKVAPLVRDIGNGLLTTFGERQKSVFKDKSREITIPLDIQTEEELKGKLSKFFPEIDFVGEETGGQVTPGETSWIVDPIDGTSNFSYGIPLFCVQLALFDGQDITMGITYLPYFKEMFYALKGEGAFLNEKPIHVSRTEESKKAVVAVIKGVSSEAYEWFPNGIKRVLSVARTTRHIGSAGISAVYVAAGRLDAYVNKDSKVTDYAAPAIIIREAGGKITDFNGREWDLRDSEFLASNGKVHADLLKVLG